LAIVIDTKKTDVVTIHGPTEYLKYFKRHCRPGSGYKLASNSVGLLARTVCAGLALSSQRILKKDPIYIINK
jgi:hypothetical protein